MAKPIDEMAVLTKASVQFIKDKVSGDYEAIVIVGTGTRTLDILCDLEGIAQCPVISSDTVMYWWAAQHLNLTLLPNMGRVRNLSYQGIPLTKDDHFCTTQSIEELPPNKFFFI